MGKTIVVIGVGIAAGVIGILGAYLMHQESIERDYVNQVNNIKSELDKITIELTGNLLPKLESKAMSMADAKFSLSSLVDDANQLHHRALSMDVPDKYKSAHPHLIHGLDYFVKAMQAGKDAFQYTEDALGASERLQTPPTAVIDAIFGFGSLQNLSGMNDDVYSNVESAKSAYNNAIMYYGQAEGELKTFYSLAQISIAQPLPFKPSAPPTREMLEECKSLGIPEFTCNEEQILAKKKPQ